MFSPESVKTDIILKLTIFLYVFPQWKHANMYLKLKEIWARIDEY